MYYTHVMRLLTIDKLTISLKELMLRALTGNYSVIKCLIHKEMRLKSKEKVLDIGCGTGILAPIFPKKAYVGTDIDRRLIAYAKDEHQGYMFQTMDASLLTFPKETFEWALVVGVIHHLNPVTASRTMKQLQRILKPEGKVLLIEAIPPIHSYNVIGKILRSLDEGHHIRSVSDYTKLFSHYLTVTKSYTQPGGLFDYGVFVLQKRKNSSITK